MKFTADKNAIIKVMTHASRIIEKRNTIPILSNVLIEADGDTLTFKSTDLDLEVTLTAKAEVQVGGVITVPAALLFDICRKLSGDTISFTMDDDKRKMKVQSGRSKFELNCLPAEDFPDITMTGAFTHQFNVTSADLRKLVSRTSFAVSTEETRYYLNGIFLHAAENNSGALKLRAVATDGHRLALCDIDQPDGAGGMPGVIIPRKTVGEIEKMLDLAKDVEISLSSTKIRFQLGDTSMVSKLIDGTFPDYVRVIPKNGNKIVIADTKAISAASDRVSIVSSERGKAVKLGFRQNLLMLTVNNPDSGMAEDEVAVEYDGDDLDVGFNNRYLQDILVNITSKKARITLDDAGSPALIKDEEGDDVTYVLMPMRI